MIIEKMEVEEKWQNINAVSAVIFMTKKKRGSPLLDSKCPGLWNDDGINGGKRQRSCCFYCSGKQMRLPEELAYDPAYARCDASCRYMDDIHEMAVTGKSIIGAMGTPMPMPGWDDILLLGNQLESAAAQWS